MKKLLTVLFAIISGTSTFAVDMRNNGVDSMKVQDKFYETLLLEPILKYDVKLHVVKKAEEILIEPVLKYDVNLLVEKEEEILIEPILKYDVKLHVVKKAEEILIEPVLKYDVNLLVEKEEEILIEPVLKYNVKLNVVRKAEEILTEPVLKYDVQLKVLNKPAVNDNINTNKSDAGKSFKPITRVYEEITVEPIVKICKMLQKLIDMVKEEELRKVAALEAGVTISADTNKLPVVKTDLGLDSLDMTQAIDTSDKQAFNSRDMEAVTVVAKKNPIERKADKVIVNVDAMTSASGGNALEVLEKTPGVVVDKDGNISMSGKQGVLVLIDGKQTYMSSSDLANYLKGLSANNLDKIELMTNPSAKYDAAGNAGVINIITKKQTQRGLNGNVSSTVGATRYFHTQNSLNLNYRKDKLNLFTAWNGNYRKRFDELNLDRQFFLPDGTTDLNFAQYSENVRRNKYFSGKLGFDYLASKQTNFGMVVSSYYMPGSTVGKNTSLLNSGNNGLDSSVVANNYEKYSWKNGSVNLNFRHEFDSAKSGKELTADIDYVQFKNLRDQTFRNRSFDKNDMLMNSQILEGHLPSTIKIMSAKSDYSQQILKKYKFETGVKFSKVETENVASYFDIVSNTPVRNDNLTNNFDYEESIAAGYLNFSGSAGKWGFQGGLRGEYTKYHGKQYGNAVQSDSSFKRDYFSLFPTAYASYQVDKKNQLSMSYGRRIERPDYGSLNPFVYFIDKYTMAGGNPFLQPMYTDIVELGYSYGRNLHAKLSYSGTQGLIAQVFQTTDHSTIMRNSNYGTRDVVNLNVNYRWKLNNILTTNIYSEATYNKYKGLANGFPLKQEGLTYFFHLNNQFTFNKGWSADLVGYFRTKGWEGQVEVLPFYNLSTGVQKKILNDKGSLKLAINNITQAQIFKGDILMENAYAHFRNQQYNRSASLTFTYRFGKPIKGLPIKKRAGGVDEETRVKAS